MNDPRHEMNERLERTSVRTAHEHLLADLKAMLDGELSMLRVLSMRAHLLFCPSCREEVVWLKRLGEDMRDLERAIPNPRLRARILAALPEAPPGRPASAPRPGSGWMRLAPAPAFAAIGAFACAAAVLIVFFSRQQTTAAPSNLTNQIIAKPRTDSPTVAEDPARSAPNISINLDPTPDRDNQFADKYVEQWLQNHSKHELQEMAKNRGSFAKLLAAVQSERGLTDGGEPVRLELAVNNVGDMANRLQVWAKSVGGNLADPPSNSRSSVPPMVNPSESPNRSVAVANPAPEFAFVVRVPAAKVASLEPLLIQAGAWRAAKSRKSPAMRGASSNAPARMDNPIAQPAKRIAATQVARADGSTLPDAADVLAKPGAPTTSAAVGTSGYAEQTVGRDGADPMVTLRIQLTSLEAPIP